MGHIYKDIYGTVRDRGFLLTKLKRGLGWGT
jgi:hypothetical protein